MITKGGYRYEVVDKVVRAWLDTQAENEAPCLLQDVKDNSGEPFADDAEATAWIEALIAEANKPRPVVEETPAEVVTE